VTTLSAAKQRARDARTRNSRWHSLFRRHPPRAYLCAHKACASARIASQHQHRFSHCAALKKKAQKERQKKRKNIGIEGRT